MSDPEPQLCCLQDGAVLLLSEDERTTAVTATPTTTQAAVFCPGVILAQPDKMRTRQIAMILVMVDPFVFS